MKRTTRAILIAFLVAWPVGWVYLRAFHWNSTPPISIELVSTPILALISYALVFNLITSRHFGRRLAITFALVILQWLCILLIFVR